MIYRRLTTLRVTLETQTGTTESLGVQTEGLRLGKKETRLTVAGFFLLVSVPIFYPEADRQRTSERFLYDLY